MKGPLAMMKQRQRGFTMVTTVGLVAVVAVSALVVLDMVQLDFEQVAQQRRTIASRHAAEGGLMELLNDRDVVSNMPTMSTANLKATHTPASSSVFGKLHQVQGERAFDADIELVRQVPMLESSHTVVRAFVYDVRVRARTGDGGTSRIQAQVYRVASARPGIIQPRMHAR